MKYLVAAILLVILGKYAMNTPDIVTTVTNHKELFIAGLLALAVRPYLKRIF